MESSSRPKRATRNKNPTYTFKAEEDFVKAKLTGKRKHEILELLKRDLGRPSKAAEVGSGKHLEKLGGEVGVPPKDLRKWLGITDDLTLVTDGSLSSKKKLRASSKELPKKDIVEVLGEEVARLQRQLNEIVQGDKDNLPSDEELMKLQEEIQHATEQVDEALKRLSIGGKGSLMKEEEIQQATEQIKEAVKLLLTDRKCSPSEEKEEEIQQAAEQIDEAVKLLPTQGKDSSLNEEWPVLVQSKPLVPDEDVPMEMDLPMTEAPEKEDLLYFDWSQERKDNIKAFLQLCDKKAEKSKVKSEGIQSDGSSRSKHDGNSDKSDEAVEKTQNSPQKDQDEKSADILVEMKGLGGLEIEKKEE